jgi:hypothetical protein
MRCGLCAWLLLFYAASLCAQAVPLPVDPGAAVSPDAAVVGFPLSEPVAEPPPIPFGATHEALAYPYLGWLRFEALLWWVKDGPIAEPLLTTGRSVLAGGAALGQPETSVVIGHSDHDFGMFFGSRLSWGFWFDPSQSCGLEVSGFLLERRAVLLSAEADAGGSPVLARPFIDAMTGEERAAFVTFPGRFAGGLGVSLTDHLWGVETNLLATVAGGGVPRHAHRFPWGEWRLGLMTGFRYLDLREDLNIQQTSQLLPGNPGGVANFGGQLIRAPSILYLNEVFAARNQFYGGQVGAQLEWVHGALFVDVLGKVAVGGCHEVLTINGATGLDRIPAIPGGLQTLEGAFLASPTNIGRQGAERLCVVPELELTVGWQWGTHVRLSVGYNLLYWSRVVRPGEQLDRTVNLSYIPINPGPGSEVGPERPAPRFVESDFWAQGLQFGFEVRY